MVTVRPLLTHALSMIPVHKGIAFDLGPGSGSETHALLHAGYDVIAIDNFKEFLTDLTVHQAVQPYIKQLTTLHTTFKACQWHTLPDAHLVFAGFSLMYIPPNAYATTIRTILSKILPGGYFVGHMSTHSYEVEQIDGYYRSEVTYTPHQTTDNMLTYFDQFEVMFFKEAHTLYPGNHERENTPDVAYSIIAQRRVP